ncbi:ATP-binding protein, partial [bacterium]|nr:ATP-binding protein [bacterium]
DLNKMVKEVVETIAPPSNIHIAVENKLPNIRSEKTRIKQIFLNLLNNAVKYNDKPKGEIRIFYDTNNGYWKFGIADNGPGIHEKYYEKIFQIFQTLAPRDKIESTGVGLALVKKIVEMYGGKIWVESKVGYGSTFFFTLPKNKEIPVNA